MKTIINYISESFEDGKNGHYEEFVDEETGELVKLWVNDPDPEELKRQEEKRRADWKAWKEKREKERKLRDDSGIEDVIEEILNIQQRLKELHDEFNEITRDQEEEVGGLYVQGKEKEAEEKAQEYGERFNKNEEEQEELRKQLSKAIKKRDKINKALSAKLEKLWSEK